MLKKRELRLMIVDDEPIIHKTLGDYLSKCGHQVQGEYRADSALKRLQENEYDLVLVDIRMPEIDGLSLLREIKKLDITMPVVIITAHASFETAIEALRSGATDFLAKPIKMLEIDAVIEKSLHVRHILQQNKRLLEKVDELWSTYDRRTRQKVLIGLSAETQHVRLQIKEAAEAGCDSLLVTGETGTGKEIVAQQFHRESCSKSAPFIAVNCPSLPETLLERELFGHEKGTFTDATQDKPGYFEIADGGTLLLDEIGDLSPAAQATLLRVIETRTFRRLGGSKEISVNLRLVAATNAPLEEYVQKGKFRKDLFYRLNMFTITLAPLRDRRQDIIPLAEHFLSNFVVRRNIAHFGFSEDARNSLLNYDYPGNVRELRNIVERAALLCRSEHIEARHLNLAQPGKTPGFSNLTCEDASYGDEKARIIQALENANWNRKQAAVDLGIPYSTLRYKIKTMGIA